MKPATHDLESLIGAAQTEMDNAQLRAATTPAPRFGVIRHVRWVGIVAALVFAVIQLAPLFHFSNSGRTAQDLDTIIEQARQSVETARATLGRLPDALPNAALAGLVSYTPVGNSYQLFTAAGGISVTLELDGTKTVKRGPTP